MEKEYLDLLVKCVELGRIYEQWGDFRDYERHVRLQKKDPQTDQAVDHPREAFFEKIAEIETTVNNFEKSGKPYPLVELISKNGLDETERKILYFFIAQKFIGFRLNRRQIINLFSDNNENEFIRLKLFFDSNSTKLFSSGIIDNDPFPSKNDLDLSNDIYRKICGIVDENKESVKKEIEDKIPSPAEIYSALDKWVIGQDEAKKILGLAVYRQSLAVRHKDLKTKTNNIIMIGPTGVGKTYLVRTLAQFLKVPVAFVSANEYTKTGYVGVSVGDMVGELYQRAGKDRERAEKGIIFIDELDKIAARDVSFNHYSRRDVSGRSVQEELLNIVETERPRVFHYGTYLNSEVTLDISRVLFIGAGVFEGLSEIASQRTEASSIGFNSIPEKLAPNPLQIQQEDLITYGFISELLGRFQQLVKLSDLTERDLARIMVESNDSLVEQYKKEFQKCFNVELEVTASAVKKMAVFAKRRNTGARGLNSIMEEVLRPIYFELADKGSEQRKIIIDENCVKEEHGGRRDRQRICGSVDQKYS